MLIGAAARALEDGRTETTIGDLLITLSRAERLGPSCPSWPVEKPGSAQRSAPRTRRAARIGNRGLTVESAGLAPVGAVGGATVRCSMRSVMAHPAIWLGVCRLRTRDPG